MSQLIGRPKLTKIPGELPKIPSEKYIERFDRLTKIQLLEIKERQEKLLRNKFQISKLSDKGKRIRDLYDKVNKELENRDEIEKASKLFSDLNIASTGQKKMTNLEWTGNCDTVNEQNVLDSDDEEEIDPLKIIAQSTNRKSTVKILPPEKSLITEEDLKEIESFKVGELNIDTSQKRSLKNPILNDFTEVNGSLSSSGTSQASVELEPRAFYLLEKGVDDYPQKEGFKPFKTTKTNVHDPEKEKHRKFGKHWEVTAATPFPIQHCGVKSLTLKDSVEIHADYLTRLENLQRQRTEERLKAKMERLGSLGLSIPDEATLKLNSFFVSYRDNASDIPSESDEEQENPFNSDDEVQDEEEEKGGVSYVVYK